MIISYLPEFLTVVVVHLFAVMSPGPDFAMISRNSLVYSRKTGIYSSVGLGFGILVHVAYCLIGIGFIISKSILLFNIIKWLGAAYLIYIGYKSFRTKQNHSSEKSAAEKKTNVGTFAAIRIGFFTNVLNPKATLFFLSLFTQVINPQTPLIVQVVYGLYMSFATFAWFAFVAMVLSQKAIKLRFSAIQKYIERAFGALLIVLGIKVALSSSK